jgi:hypothetical protein
VSSPGRLLIHAVSSYRGRHLTQRNARCAREIGNLDLDQRLIDRARTALGAPTETHAITRAVTVALELAEFRREVARGAALPYGTGGFAVMGLRFRHDLPAA